MLTGKQKGFLRSMANTERALFQVGKEGCTYSLYSTISDSLEAHELLKVSVLKTCPQPVREVALDIAGHTRAEIVQIVGRVILLYRPSKKKVIVLP